MLGRAVYKNPMLLADVDSMFYGEQPVEVSRRQIIEEYLEYLRAEISRGAPESVVRHLARHLPQWFHAKLDPRDLLSGALLSGNPLIDPAQV